MNRTLDPAPAPDTSSLVLFRVARQRFGLSLAEVERILPAARVKTLRRVPRKIVGVVHLPSGSIPVLSLRRHLGLDERKVEPTDRLLVVRSGSHRLALVDEETDGGPEDLPCAEVLYDKGVVRIEGGLCYIAEVSRLLDAGEELRVRKALDRRRRPYQRLARPAVYARGKSLRDSGSQLRIP